MQWFRSLAGFTDESHEVVGIRSHWLRVKTFFRDVQAAPDPRHIAARINELEPELDGIITLLAQERLQFLQCVEDSSLPLPPCYAFILGEGEKARAKDGTLAEGGHDMVTAACQYAKHDIPEGARALMLRFLTRLFREVDADSGKSLLHFSNDYIAVPVFDAISRISESLSPWLHNSLTNQKAAGAAAPGPLRASRSIQRDRREIVALLQVLCAKVEAIPSVASFFLCRSHDGADTSRRLLLVEAIVPFIKDGVADLPDRDRIATARNALAGILCIARSTDPVVQGFLLADDRIVQLVAHELCQALVTACKVPANVEYPLQVACIGDAVSFLDTLALHAPMVASAWLVRSRYFVRTFLRDTARVLFTSTDERVYSNVATIFAFLLQRNYVRSAAMREELTDFFFLPTTVDVVETVEGAASSAPTKAPALFEALILPKVHDLCESSAVASITLVRALAEAEPAAFMRHALGLKGPLEIAESVVAAAFPQAELRARVRGPSALVPNLKIKDVFPKAVDTSVGLCGTDTQAFGNEVLRRLLQIELNLSPGCGATDAAADCRPVISSAVGQGPSDPLAAIDRGVFFSEAVNQAPVIGALARKLASITDQSVAVNAALTGAISTIALLPDYRVVYTIFDNERNGAVAAQLLRSAAQVDAVLEADKARCQQQNSGPGGALATSMLTQVKRACQRSTFEGGAAAGAAPGSHVDPAASGMGARPSTNDSRFVDACIVLEGFRHEMLAVVAQVEFSLNLFELTV